MLSMLWRDKVALFTVSARKYVAYTRQKLLNISSSKPPAFFKAIQILKIMQNFNYFDFDEA